MVVGLVLHGAMYGPQAAFLSELFGTKVRYSGVSIGSQLASIVAGASAPLVAVALLGSFDQPKPGAVAMYLVVCAVVTLIAVLTYGDPQPGPRRGQGRGTEGDAPGRAGLTREPRHSPRRSPSRGGAGGAQPASFPGRVGRSSRWASSSVVSGASGPEPRSWPSSGPDVPSVVSGESL